MLSRLRHEWHLFVECEPGSRFERLHERKRRDGKRWARRLFWWSTGVLLIFAGFVMLFTPGPGILGIAFGVACLAQESLPFARKCDRAELRVRRAAARWLRARAERVRRGKSAGDR